MKESGRFFLLSECCRISRSIGVISEKGDSLGYSAEESTRKNGSIQLSIVNVQVLCLSLSYSS